MARRMPRTGEPRIAIHGEKRTIDRENPHMSGADGVAQLSLSGTFRILANLWSARQPPRARFVSGGCEARRAWAVRTAAEGATMAKTAQTTKTSAKKPAAKKANAKADSKTTSRAGAKTTAT